MLFMADTPLAQAYCVKILYNFCGLTCILGLTSPNNQVSLTIKEQSVLSQ